MPARGGSSRTKESRKPLPGEAFRRVRTAHAREMAEDYVEAIAETIEAEGECRVKHLAAKFGVTHVTVSKAVARLVEQGLAETERQKPIELTAAGRKLARESKRRHDIVLAFLRALGVSEATAEADSEGIEHHISPETLEKLREFVERGQSAER
ncbi:MAG: manganese-binding transcriptional regulator MntR [Phycisphaerales bacterium]